MHSQPGSSGATTTPSGKKNERRHNNNSNRSSETANKTGSTSNTNSTSNARNAKQIASNRLSETNTGSAASRFTTSSAQRILVFASAQLHCSQNWQILRLIAPFSTTLKNNSYSAILSIHYAFSYGERDYSLRTKVK